MNGKKITTVLGMVLLTSITCVGAAFHPGDRGTQITEIQQALVKQGMHLAVDGDYGADTQEAIRTFQKKHGIYADGVMGAKTYAVLMKKNMPENKTIRFVNKTEDLVEGPVVANVATANHEVRTIQQALVRQGYAVDVDGVFGPGTEQALRRFQARRGLTVDGVIGPETFYALTGQVLASGSVHVGNTAELNVAPTGSARSASATVRRLLGVAQRYMGTPYVFGGTTPSGFDCSGFTRYVFSEVGVSLPRMADAQYSMGTSVSQEKLRPGDLVFFTTYTPGVSHVGIYLGKRQFINASNDGVSVADLNSTYWAQRYIGAKRTLG